VTDAECTEILAEFRKLTLGPDLSAALDHAIGVLARHPAFTVPASIDRTGGKMVAATTVGVLMNGVAA